MTSYKLNMVGFKNRNNLEKCILKTLKIQILQLNQCQDFEYTLKLLKLKDLKSSSDSKSLVIIKFWVQNEKLKSYGIRKIKFY